MNPLIGIVTVLYNSGSVLNDFFATLNQQTYRNFILYVVDNLSPDNSLDETRRLAETVDFDCIIIENEANYGVAKGNNIGIRAALADGCEKILLSNNDVVLAPETIASLYHGMCTAGASMAVPKIYFHHGDRMIWAAGGYFRKWKGGTLHRGFGETDKGQYDIACEIEYAPTCFMLIDKDVFKRVGMMDEWYFVYYDDTDFVYRAQCQGEKLYYIPDSVLWHKEGSSTGVGSPFTLYYLNRNLIYFTRKNQSQMRLWYTIVTHWGVHLTLHPFLYNKSQYHAERKGLWDGLKSLLQRHEN